jgi:hypothetical protein
MGHPFGRMMDSEEDPFGRKLFEKLKSPTNRRNLNSQNLFPEDFFDRRFSSTGKAIRSRFESIPKQAKEILGIGKKDATPFLVQLRMKKNLFDQEKINFGSTISDKKQVLSSPHRKDFHLPSQMFHSPG